ncbi:uncharacterized protein V6R79_023035 [Siganus canaliculatus]
MHDPLRHGLRGTPHSDHVEDDAFLPLPPPHSPGVGGDDPGPFEDDLENGDVSKLAEVPAGKRKGVKRPQPKLDSNRLTSDRGLPALRNLFDSVHFKGKGHEVEDLHLLMQKMENWAHRLYPKLQFEDFIDKVEKLGKKKEVQTCLKRIRLDMPLTHEDYTGQDGEDEAALEADVFGADPDPFNNTSFQGDLEEPVHSTPAPASLPSPTSLTEEQRKHIEQNRQRALERKLARQQQQHIGPSESQTVDLSTSPDELTSASSVAVDQAKDQDATEDLDLEPASST